MAIQNAKEVVLLACKTAELIEGIAEGVSFDDVAKLIAVGKAVGPGVKDAKLALYEYAKMSDAEALELDNYIQKELDLKDDQVEGVIESSLKVVIELRALASLVIKQPVPVPGA